MIKNLSAVIIQL